MGTEKWILSVFVLGFVFIGYVHSKGFYTIISPKQIHPNSVHNVSITTHDIDEDVIVRFDIKCLPYIGNNFTFSHLVTVAPNSTKNVNFRFDNLPNGKFNFTAKGIQGIEFENWTRLLFVPKSILCFIQTDKRIYMPGSIVRYRIIVLNSDLKVIPSDVIGSVNITVFNSNKLKIKELNHVKLNDHGMYSSEFGLAKDIDTGFWTIRVRSENTDEVFLEQIEVAEYKLPNFRVQIDVPIWSTYNTRSIKARIRANYNYGKPVNGTYTAFLCPEPYEGYPKQPIANKTGLINGTTIVEFLFKNDLNIQQKYDRQYIIDVTVEDALNGQRHNSSVEMGVYVYDYKIGFVDAPDYFKPGLDYLIRVKVSHHNDKPVDYQTADNVTIYYGFEYESSKSNLLNVSLNKYGEALGEIPILKNASKLYVLAEYKDATIELPHILRERTKRNAFVLSKLLTNKPTVDEDVLVEVTSTHRMTKLTYLLVGKDSTIFANTVSVKNQTKLILKFMATTKMVPRSTLLVYYMTKNGFIASDAMDLKVEMKDNFKIRLSQKQVSPGEMVNITIQAPENATVNILALDESVLLLKGNENDISKSTVQEKFRHFITNENVRVQRRTIEQEDRRQVNFKVFRDAGVVLFTNAVKIKKKNVLFQTIPNTNKLRGPNKDSDEDDQDEEDLEMITSKEILLRRNAYNIRKQFPETWLWWDVVKQNSREMILTTKVPDTITKWIINGFSIDPTQGMSVLSKKVALTVFKPFFIAMDLPISIKRGEMLTIPVILHNYSNKSLIIDLIFHNTKKEFCFDSLSICTASYKVRVHLDNNTEQPLNFRITPYSIGEIALKISTFSDEVLMDRIERFLTVKPEGVTKYINQAYFVDLRQKNKFELFLEPTIPLNYIPDSLDIQVKMSKNIMQSSMENLDELVSLPQGCGEQNLLSFVPNVVVLDYMQNTKQKNDQLRMKSLKFLQQSYQRQLKFRHPNGAFSTFGKADEVGSIWLTSYVIRSINWARRYITVDQKIQNRALKWLNSTQQEDGSWIEVGKTIRDSIEKYSLGENGSVTSLTAFTLWTFLEHPKGFTKYNATIQRAISYLNNNINNVNDSYSIALTAFVLQSAGRDEFSQYFDLLQNTNMNRYNGKIWWTSSRLSTNAELNKPPSALDIEITSYALLAAISANQMQDTSPVLKWLISQRNSNGGFKSSQDTIVGLYAMSKMAREYRKFNSKLNFTVNNIPIRDFTAIKTLRINPDLQSLFVQATGSGAGIIELTAKYNVMPAKNDSNQDEYFTISPTVQPLMDDNLINVTVCTRFNSNSKFGEDWWRRDTNMAIIEVKLPSGYKLDESSYGLLKLGQDHLQKLETEDDETKVLLYYDKLTRARTCPHLVAYKSHQVGKCQDGLVTVYDYYDPEIETMVKF